MLKNNELRIGNIIEWNKSIFNVCKISEDSIENELWCKPLTEIHPIPLTEDWLLKFGFKKDNDFGNWHLSDYEIFSSGNRYFVAATKEDVVYWYNDACDDYYSSVRKIDTVHQLQNLFYCLCGKELEIKNL